MSKLWREAAIAAFVSGTLAACASPHYPINEDQAPGPPPLTAPHPEYPIDESSPPPASVAPAPAAPAAEAAPAPPPLSAPVAPVQSQSLPPPTPSVSTSDDPQPVLQRASLSSEATPTPAVASTSAPASPAPSPAAQPSLTPQMVIHDQSATPAPPPPPAARPFAPVREAYAQPRLERRAVVRYAINGDVVGASGDEFENYEVQKGDHIDELARAFSTSRRVLLKANDIRAPYVIRPGQILKVPVAKAYVARSGDTLSGVARRFSVEPGELAEINHLSVHASLRPGEEIGLPSSMRDRGPQRLTSYETEYAEAAPARAWRAPPEPAYVPPATTSPTAVSGGGGYGYHASPAQAPPPERRFAETYSAPPVSQNSYGYHAPPPPGAAAQAAAGLSDAQIEQAAHGRFVWPVRGDIVARFGPQGIGRRNDGVDIKAAEGTTVKAAAPGEVVYAGNQVPGFGNLVLIKHADGWVTAYAHLDTVDVQMREQVAQGQALGSVGMTGGVTEPELHFEVRYAATPADKARPVDPVLVLPVG